MKKLLSIFSISAILGSGTILSGGGIACNSSTPPKQKSIPIAKIIPIPKPTPPKPKPTELTLNNISIININVNLNASGDGFVLDGIAAYKNVEEQIIQQYKTIFPKANLSLNDFASNSTSLANKSWAVQVYNLDGTTPIANQQNQALVFPSDYKVLKDNALNVKITTNDANVIVKSSKANPATQKQVVVEGVLNKFIYTNKNANSNNAVSADLTKTATQNNLLQSKVINFSSGEYNLGLAQNLLNFDANFDALESGVYNLNPAKRAIISKAIVTNLNNQLTSETKKLNDSGILTTAQNNVPQDQAITLNNSDVDFFAVNLTDSVSALESGNLGSQWKIFVRIKVSGWNTYLQNYLAKNNTYVYGYLGTSGENTAKLDLSTLATLNAVQVSKNSQGQIIFDGSASYNSIRDEIIKEYNKMFWSQPQISESNFNLNSTITTTEKPWAIQILNGDGIPVENLANRVLKFSSTYTLANDALEIKINTTNTNVAHTEVTLNGYLNKFAFSNADANNNHNLVLNTLTPQPEFTPASTINLNTGPKALDLDFDGSTSATGLLTQIENSANALKLTNDVIDNLNNAYDQHIVNLQLKNLIHKLQTLTENTSPYLLKNPVGGDQILWIYVRQTHDQADHAFVQREGTSELCVANQTVDVYLKIEIKNWNYLSSEHNKFITPSDTCVYAYLGQATKD